MTESESESLVEIIKIAEDASFVDSDGDEIVFEPMPGLSAEEIDHFARSLPCPLPEDVRHLLAYTRGFEGVVADVVDFTGESMLFGLEDVFLYALPIASDGFGNYWVIDLNAQSQEFGPVYFACHDAPVILHQSKTLVEFLVELFRHCTPPYESLVDDVHEDRLHNVWRKNPDVLSHAEAVQHSDQIVSEFAQSLDESWSIIDLRGATPGMGFSWGRYGPKTQIARLGELPVFAYKRPRGLLQKLFGR